MYLEALNAVPTDIPDRNGHVMCGVQQQNVNTEGLNFLTMPSSTGQHRENMRVATEGIHREDVRQE